MSRKKYVLIIIILSLGGALYALIYGQMQKTKMSTLPKQYVFDRDGPLNTGVLFIRNLKYKKEYLNYVKDGMSGKSVISVNFPSSNALPEGEVIYIRGYLSDSNLVEFYSPDYHHNFWGFTTGYVHRYFIHDSLRTGK